MKIIDVKVEESRRLIPLKGWESVQNALQTFDEGYTSGARATNDEAMRVIGNEASGLGAVFFLLGSTEAGARSKIVENILGKAPESVNRHGAFEQHFDYDGVGTSFFKTSVSIHSIDPGNDMFGLGIWAAYVGDKPEIGLAEHFGHQRILSSVTVEFETQPRNDDRFELDCGDVVRRLVRAELVDSKMDGVEFATKLMEYDKELALGERDDFRTHFAVGKVGHRFDYQERERRDQWRRVGARVTGPLARDYDSKDRDALATPSFKIVVSATKLVHAIEHEAESKPKGSLQKIKEALRFGALPQPREVRMWHPDQQQRAVTLAERIAVALRA